MSISVEKASSAAARAVGQSKEREAEFETIFIENYQRIYGVLFRLTGDRAEAEDLTLETFWRLWERRPARADNVAAWLYRVATRLGYNALRAVRRRTHYENVGGREAACSGATAADPATAADHAAERARVHAVLRQMRPREAQLLILRHSGLAYKEIAAALGIAPASVGTLLARAEKEFEKRYLELDEPV